MGRHASVVRGRGRRARRDGGRSHGVRRFALGHAQPARARDAVRRRAALGPSANAEEPARAQAREPGPFQPRQPVQGHRRQAGRDPQGRTRDHRPVARERRRGRFLQSSLAASGGAQSRTFGRPARRRGRPHERAREVRIPQSPGATRLFAALERAPQSDDADVLQRHRAHGEEPLGRRSRPHEGHAARAQRTHLQESPRRGPGRPAIALSRVHAPVRRHVRQQAAAVP